MVLALLAGVVAMHAMVTPMTADHPVPPLFSPAAMGHAGAGVSATGLDGVNPAGISAGAAVGLAAGPMAVGAAPTSPHPSGPAPESHGLLHLCLGVLAALTVIVLCAVAYLVRNRVIPPPVQHDARNRALWPRPPPRTAVRLARLCVLRN